MASRGSFWPPEMASLMLARMLVLRQAGLHLDGEQRVVGSGLDLRHAFVDVAVDGGGAIVAARLDLRVAGIVGAAVDHALADAVHLGEMHVGQAGDRLQRLGGQRQGVIGDEIGFPARRDFVEDAVGMALEFATPDIAHGFRRDGREDGPALDGVRVAVLAHHVFAHQARHQAAWLDGGKDVGALLVDEDGVALRHQRRAELRNEGDRAVAPHDLQVGIRIAPEGVGIDVMDRCIRHTAPPAVIARVRQANGPTVKRTATAFSTVP
jgi:hypothetical protein